MSFDYFNESNDYPLDFLDILSSLHLFIHEK